MNAYDHDLMSAPSPPRQQFCAVCGSSYWLEGHHVVFRSQGGGDGPVLTLCRRCHQGAHTHRLHFAHKSGWTYYETREPTKRDALPETGWRALVLRED